MGWFDSWFGTESNAGDPLRKLDPKLREFLERESPVKYNQRPAPEPTAQDAAKAPTPAAVTATTSRQDSAQDHSGVPVESLYQDGRYAHLWKTYRPQAVVDAETKSDHEKLTDVLEAFKDRKARVGKAALENCALEQDEWAECMRSGDVTARMTMCRDAIRKFERCYTLQNRFLRALGYLSVHDRSKEQEEDIQMHADKLYHRLMEQEAAVELAKKEGRPIPKFAPLVPKSKVQAREEEPELQLSPQLQQKMKESLEKVPEEERLAEEFAIKAELRAKAEVAGKVQGMWAEQAKEREARKAEGRQTISDRVSSLFGR